MRNFKSPGGDFGAGGLLREVKQVNGKVKPTYNQKFHNIIAPGQEIDGAHRLGNINVGGDELPNQRVRSVYFDRSPRKSRE